MSVIFGLRARGSDIAAICSLVRTNYGQHVRMLQVVQGEDGTLEFRDLPD
jgi:hypothetical protein